MLVWIISDDTARAEQSTALAHYLTDTARLLSVDEVTRAGDLTAYLTSQESSITWPDIALGAGERTASTLLAIKSANPTTKIISILDPGQHHSSFDAIIMPSYEPHPEGANILTTTGLINRITPDYLAHTRQEYTDGAYTPLSEHDLPSPRYALLLGGRHVAGNIMPEDALHLLNTLNTLISTTGGSLLITTSQRTDKATTSTLREALPTSAFLYDYRNDHYIKNPYEALLATADTLIVTGDSVRMCSEACSTGLPVYIFTPEHADFFPYDALHQELYAAGLAAPFSAIHSPPSWATISPLNEAQRIANQLKTR